MYGPFTGRGTVHGMNSIDQSLAAALADLRERRAKMGEARDKIDEACEKTDQAIEAIEDVLGTNRSALSLPAAPATYRVRPPRPVLRTSRAGGGAVGALKVLQANPRVGFTPA